jgi:predicted DNA-binding transcriptional regulator AlpA
MANIENVLTGTGLMSKRFLLKKDLRDRDGIPDSTRLKMVAEGRYPKPVWLTSRLKGWLIEEVEAYEATRIANRDCKPGEA